jgi:hypothetical protein
MQRLGKRGARWIVAVWLLSWLSAAYAACCDVSADLLPGHQTTSKHETANRNHADTFEDLRGSQVNDHCDKPGAIILHALAASVANDTRLTTSLFDVAELPSSGVGFAGLDDDSHVIWLTSNNPRIPRPRLYIRYARYLL